MKGNHTIVLLLLCLGVSLLSNAQVKPSIDRELHFEISENTAHFGAKGGSKTFTIKATDPWKISKNSTSWWTLSKKDKAVEITVHENPSISSRSGYFELKSGSKIIHVDISQNAAELYLSLSSQQLNFEADGGTQTISVSTNGSWSIGTSTVSWRHLTKNENSLSVKIDPNTNTSPRTDWFSIKAGAIEKRVEITQKAKEITLSLSQYELDFDASGGTKTITVTTNSSWDIGTNTYSWGHLTKDGNQLKIMIDANTVADPRTDYFTIKAGGQERKVNITQSAAIITWEISGTSRSYTDIASGLSYITDRIKEKGECRLGAITEYGKGIAVYGDNGAMWSSIPDSFSEKVKEIHKNGHRISSITLTNSGYYCITYQRNAWYGIVPEQMKRKLNEFNNNKEEIQSVSISENGDFAIVTDKHYFASNNSDFSNMKKANEKYGLIKNVCITNKGICVVCQNGLFYCNIPSNMETKLKQLNFHPDHVAFTDSGTFLITTETGKYSYHM